MLKLLLNVILLSSIVIVTGTDKSYTKEALTNYGQPCMSDCIDNVCVTGRSEKKSSCIPGSRPGLKYYTARDKTQHKWCKSRCGKFDKSPEDWCYVSDEKWDYCNPEMGTKIVENKAFTQTKGPCKDDCGYHNSGGRLWCHTYWYGGGWDNCNTKGFTYMQTKTRQGLDCVGYCGAHENRNYNWCVSSEEKEARCAPIARNFTLFYHMFNQLRQLEKKDGCRIKVDQQNYKHDSVPPGFVSRNAKLLEYPNIGLLTQHLSEDGNPINVYTIMPNALLDDPTLQIVVRARVTSGTIRSPYGKGQNKQRAKGKNGHIISYILGGPSEVYNIAVPTQRPVHNGTLPEWYDTEVLIRDFIVRTNGWAEITVVIVRSNISESKVPDGYAVDFSLYNYDNTLYRECNDYYYSNPNNYQ